MSWKEREFNIPYTRYVDKDIFLQLIKTDISNYFLSLFNQFPIYIPLIFRSCDKSSCLKSKTLEIFFIRMSRLSFILFFSREMSCDANRLQCDVDQYTKVRGRARRKSKSFKSESEEYDTLGSDSDTEVGTSSRTESSNHLDDSGPTSIMARSPGPNSVNQQRLALVQRPVHHSKLVFSFLCPGRAAHHVIQRAVTNYLPRLRTFQMCCTTRTNQVHQPSRHQFLRGRLSRGSKSKGKRYRWSSVHNKRCIRRGKRNYLNELQLMHYYGSLFFRA